MTVKDFKELIEDLPDEMEVIVKKDAEGNSYSPLSDIETNHVYFPLTKWSGDVYSLNWSAEDACMTPDAWEVIKAKPRVMVLCPTN